MRKGSAIRSVVAAAVVVAIVVAACLWWQRSDPPVQADASGEVNEVAAARPMVAARQRAASAPLPPADVPLRQVFDELSRRAAGGDAAAGCRLAAELERCDRIQHRLAAHDEQVWRMEHGRQVTPADKAAYAAWKKMLDVMAPGLLNAADRCEGVRSLSAAERVALWRQSALAGNPGALAHYVVGNAFRRRDTLEVLPQLQTYRREAELMALQASSRGDLQTSLALAAAYSPRRDTGERYFLAQVVKPDLARSLALYRRGSRLLPEAAPPSVRQMIDDNVAWLQLHAAPGDLEKADVLGSQWAQQWSNAPIGGSAQLKINEVGGVSDIAPTQCAP
ncbi:hypothetical protein [Xanthomonas campestris]|uniref:hypothetical protein n=1 Tax=Xanthomonas campestris TaxID=339 RepID=UPI0011156A85|nr:hypothetical protein [Xanthomonas campestris]MCF8828307.1 hypothetical protein [Xanthomonas campestris pv. raphani]MEA9842106.1 hypothetical protein [Xanthomonas campestris pv. raphani]MEA9878153.1 hypothetical protein [Xanthomonas campestris pv. raphani]MEA9891999.1 hypothetical protein [Xanthomonas campestris pv. raphani]MEA9933116.1 hypothetical protein [Xanthomonas campestris pv. raphani]